MESFVKNIIWAVLLIAAAHILAALQMSVLSIVVDIVAIAVLFMVMLRMDRQEEESVEEDSPDG